MADPLSDISMFRASTYQIKEATGQVPNAAHGAHSAAEIEKAGTQFESLLLQQMMKSMWNTTSTKDSLLGSKDEETYRDMFNQAMADNIAQGQGIGIKGVITKELNKK